MLQFVQSLRLNSLSRIRLFSQTRRSDVIAYVGRNTHSLSSVEFEHDEPLDDLKTTEKDNALHQALSNLAGEFGKESMLSLKRFFSSRCAPVISTGSLKLDLALGIGGLPKGRIVEIFGREASGKTTLALHVVKEAQKLGGYCAYLDAENAIDPSLLEAMGVDTENLLISHPDSAENLLCVVDTLTKSGSVDVIVVDSVAALVPQCEIDVPVGGMYRDLQSRILSQALRKIHYSLSQSHSIIIFLNQITGLGVSVQVVKNKLAPAMKKSDLVIEFGKGFRLEPEVFELACEHGVIVKEGNNYMIEGEVFSDRHSAEQHLIENEEVLDNVITNLRKHLFKRKLLL